MRELTVGQLKKMIEENGLTDDTKIITYTHNSMEMGQSIVDARATVQEAEKKPRTFRDAFDGGSYTTDVWALRAESGEKVLLIMG